MSLTAAPRHLVHPQQRRASVNKTHACLSSPALVPYPARSCPPARTSILHTGAPCIAYRQDKATASRLMNRLGRRGFSARISVSPYLRSCLRSFPRLSRRVSKRPRVCCRARVQRVCWAASGSETPRQGPARASMQCGGRRRTRRGRKAETSGERRRVRHRDRDEGRDKVAESRAQGWGRGAALRRATLDIRTPSALSLSPSLWGRGAALRHAGRSGL